MPLYHPTQRKRPRDLSAANSVSLPAQRSGFLGKLHVKRKKRPVAKYSSNVQMNLSRAHLGATLDPRHGVFAGVTCVTVSTMIKGDFAVHSSGFNENVMCTWISGLWLLIGTEIEITTPGAGVQGWEPAKSELAECACVYVCVTRGCASAPEIKGQGALFPWLVGGRAQGRRQFDFYLLPYCLSRGPLLHATLVISLHLSNGHPWKTLQVPAALAPSTEYHQTRLFIQYLNNPN